MFITRRRTVTGLLTSLAVATAGRQASFASEIRELPDDLANSIQAGGTVEIPAGRWHMKPTVIARGVELRGNAGGSQIFAAGGGPILKIVSPDAVILRDLAFSGAGQAADAALVEVEATADLLVEACRFADAPGPGLRLAACSGRIAGNRFDRIGTAGIFAIDSRGLAIADNRLADIGNNGIQVWTSEPGEDGTRVTGNDIRRVAATAGGTGQNGNGINVFRAGNVIVADNRISDCAFSAIRNNLGSACVIAGNAISRTGEVAIYCEFGFVGAVVSGNMLDDVALGISITNFNEGGRLAAITGNVIRRATGGGSLPSTRGIGIAAEADTSIAGNVIDGAADTAIALGWGGYSRNLSATGNVIRDCDIGIGFSVSPGAGPVLIANNRISGARRAAIAGTDHGTAATDDLVAEGVTAHGVIAGNLAD